MYSRTERQAAGPATPFFVVRNVEEMMGRPYASTLPPYDPLSDPALAKYWQRKFQWMLPVDAPPESGRRRRAQSAGGAAAGGGGRLVYQVTVRTGDATPAGSRTPRGITLFGTKSLVKQQLEGTFAPGSTVTCQVYTDPLGPLQKIKIEHAGHSARDAWYVESVTVTTPKGKVYQFDCQMWLSAFHGDRKLARTLVPMRGHGGSGGDLAGTGSVEYDVEVFTGDVPRAGTDANV